MCLAENKMFSNQMYGDEVKRIVIKEKFYLGMFILGKVTSFSG